MKIIEVVPSLYSGGAENFVVSLSNELVEKGCDVTILTFYPPKSTEFLWKKVDKRIHIMYLNKKLGVDIRLPYKLYQIIKRGQYDIAHFHIQAISYCFLSSLLYRKCKYFLTIHNDAYKEANGVHRLLRKFVFSLNLCHAITISRDSQQSFEDLYKVKSALIYNGVGAYCKNQDVDLCKYKKTPNTILFVYVASIMPKKNQVTFAKCINKLAKEGVDVSAIFLGKKAKNYDDYYSCLEKEKSENVHILGEVSNPVDYMHKSDFFVLVSEYEGMPISLLEAFSTKCIPIVTPVGGCKNVVIDNVNGIFAQSPREQDVYIAIKRALVLEKEHKIEMIRNIENDFSRYTIQNCAELHLQLFEGNFNY